VNAYIDTIPKFSDVRIPSLGIATYKMTADETASLLAPAIVAFLQEPELNVLVKPAGGKIYTIFSSIDVIHFNALLHQRNKYFSNSFYRC
jgi:hypothetical protein